MGRIIATAWTERDVHRLENRDASMQPFSATNELITCDCMLFIRRTYVGRRGHSGPIFRLRYFRRLARNQQIQIVYEPTRTFYELLRTLWMFVNCNNHLGLVIMPQRYIQVSAATAHRAQGCERLFSSCSRREWAQSAPQRATRAYKGSAPPPVRSAEGGCAGSLR